LRTLVPTVPLPDPPAPSELIRSGRAGHKELTFEIRAITPVIGAGYEAGEGDLVTPVRGGTIRGLLRHWWRAFYNARSIDSLREKEKTLWGWASYPGLIDVHVHHIKASDPKDNWTLYEHLDRLGGQTLSTQEQDTAKYVLFPLQKPRQNRDARPKRGVLEQLSFQLTIRYPVEGDTEKHVRAAMRGWIQFGGIGARTTRGCGSLYCAEFSPQNIQQARSWPVAQLFEVADGWPVYLKPPLVKPTSGRPLSAWLAAGQILREFRQHPIGRTGRSRSHWPEPDSIRQFTGLGPSAHLDNLTHADQNYPRAELGLPIVFHFKGELENDCNLEPQGATRLASPLIFKALAFGDGTQAVPIILNLHYRSWPANVEVKGGSAWPSNPVLDWKTAVLDPAVANYQKSPLRGRTKRGSAVEALLNYAREKGFQ